METGRVTKKQNMVNGQTLRQWVIADLKNAGISVEKPGVHQSLLGSNEMVPVWRLLMESDDNFNGIGPAASLVITLC